MNSLLRVINGYSLNNTGRIFMTFLDSASPNLAPALCPNLLFSARLGNLQLPDAVLGVRTVALQSKCSRAEEHHGSIRLIHTHSARQVCAHRPVRGRRLGRDRL